MSDPSPLSLPREEWNPYFRRIFDHSAAKPDAWKDHPWEGHTVFKIGEKLFVILPEPSGATFTLKAHPDELEALLTMPNVQRAPYIGRYGWVQLAIENEAQLEVALDLVDTSYELVAKKAGKRKPAK